MFTERQLLTVVPLTYRKFPLSSPVCNVAECRFLTYLVDSVYDNCPIKVSRQMITGGSALFPVTSVHVITKPERYGTKSSLIISSNNRIFEGMILHNKKAFRFMRSRATFPAHPSGQADLLTVKPKLDRLGISIPSESTPFVDIFTHLLYRLNLQPGSAFVSNLEVFNEYVNHLSSSGE